MELSDLTQREVDLILAALTAVSESGSNNVETWQLRLKLEAQSGVKTDGHLAAKLMATAHEEWLALDD